jgi:hypothetical protein
MHFMYGRANEKSLEAGRLSAGHCLQRRIPSHILFSKLQQRLSESESFAPRSSHRSNFRYGSSSTETNGRRSRNKCVKNCSCWPYRLPPCLENFPWTVTFPHQIQRVQILTTPDHCARGMFFQRFLAKCLVNTHFVTNIQFTDEAGFIETVIWTFITPPPVYGFMTKSTLPWHQGININFPSMSEWAFSVINS